jgi:hypothetical protein
LKGTNTIQEALECHFISTQSLPSLLQVLSAMLNTTKALRQWEATLSLLGEYVTWTFSPNNNGIAHQGRAG